jgi:hypothetical protein
MDELQEKALEEVLAEAKRLLAAMEHYAGDFPLDVHHSDVVALSSAVHRAERVRATT